MTKFELVKNQSLREYYGNQKFASSACGSHKFCAAGPRVLAPDRRGRRRQEVAAGDVHVAATRADAADRGPPPHKWNRCTKPSGGSVARDSETDKDVSQAVR